MVFKAKITVTLRKSILDPQGKAVHHAMENLSMNDVKDVRIGKFVEMTMTSTTKEEAERLAEQACKKLLANPVMEDYAYTIETL